LRWAGPRRRFTGPGPAISATKPCGAGSRSGGCSPLRFPRAQPGWLARCVDCGHDLPSGPPRGRRLRMLGL